MNKDIIVEFSGWVKISPENVYLINIGNGDKDGEKIQGSEWLKLSKDDRGDYILEDAIAAIRDSNDGEWLELDFFEESI